MYQPRHTAMKSAYLLRFASGARRHTVGCWAKMSPKELLVAVGVFNARQVFITEGELALHDLRPLTTLLITSSCQRVQAPVDKPVDIDKLLTLNIGGATKPAIWMQSLSQGRRAAELSIQEVTARD